MPIEVQAIYEGGVLKPSTPLPLGERETVTITINPVNGRFRQVAESFQWTGDRETLRRFAEDDDLLESQ